MAEEAPPNPPADGEPRYGGYSRFEIELEVGLFPLSAFPLPLTLCAQFVQSLANPYYLNHLASTKVLSDPAFVAYLAYLRYWSKPPYSKYLTYPGPTLKHLELLQQERFRNEIISPELVQALAGEGLKGSVDWHKDD